MENYGGGLHALCRTGMVPWVYHFFEHSDKEDRSHRFFDIHKLAPRKGLLISLNILALDETKFSKQVIENIFSKYPRKHS